MSGGGFSFRPYFEGEVAVDRVPDDFFERMELRLADGLLVRGQRKRANYRVTMRSAGTMEFEAQGFLTAYAIGLNHVRLQQTGRTAIRYEVGFARWTRYAVIHGWLVGLLVGAACLLPGAWRDIESYRHGPLVFGAMILFWALAWPWLLTAIHRPFARKALERILREELGAAPVLRAAP
jgi:hypothetical protein